MALTASPNLIIICKYIIKTLTFDHKITEFNKISNPCNLGAGAMQVIAVLTPAAEKSMTRYSSYQE